MSNNNKICLDHPECLKLLNDLSMNNCDGQLKTKNK